MVSGDFTPYACLSQHRKDVEMILAIARKLGQSLPLSETPFKILKNAEIAGDGDLDNAAIIREFQRLGKLPRLGKNPLSIDCNKR